MKIEALKQLVENALSLDRIAVIESVKKISEDLKKSGKDALAADLLTKIDTSYKLSASSIQQYEILRQFPNDSTKFWTSNTTFVKLRDFLLLRNNEQNTRVFIHGKPGTGKTTFVKEISRDIKKEILYVNAQNLISSKLGETQKNLDLLLNDCIKSAGKYIILMDEFDSIIGSRNREIHDEYHRLIGSFNIFLDTLPKNIILFAITNVISHIDEATLRRFNVDILLNEIDLNVFTFQLFNQATLNKIDYNINVSRKLVHINSQSLDYSSIEKIVTNSQIEKCSIETSIAKILSIDDVSKLRKLGLTLDDIAVVKKISKAGVAKILGSKK